MEFRNLSNVYLALLLFSFKDLLNNKVYAALLNFDVVTISMIYMIMYSECNNINDFDMNLLKIILCIFLC